MADGSKKDWTNYRKKLERQKIHLLVAVALGVLISLTVISLVVPIPVEKTIQAIEIKLDDPSYCVEREITIRGTYHLNVSSPHRYSGILSISGYEETVEPNQLWPISFRDDGEIFGYYWEEEIAGSPRKEYHTAWSGIIYSEFGFKNALIIVGSQSENGNYRYPSGNSPIIVFDAVDWENAMERVAKTIVTPHG